MEILEMSGQLRNYLTAEFIREASHEETIASMIAASHDGGAGVIFGEGLPLGLRVYVDGGTLCKLTLRATRARAVMDGDFELVILCDRAFRGDAYSVGRVAEFLYAANGYQAR